MRWKWLNACTLWNTLCGLVFCAGITSQYYFYKAKVDDARRAAQCTATPINDKNVYPIWRSFPVQFGIDRSVPLEAREAIYRSADHWRNVLGREVFTFTQTESIEQKTDGNSIIYWNTGKYQQPSEQQAVTKMIWSGSKIYDSDIIINVHQFQIDYSDTFVPGSVDLESLMIHELGHAIGLGHIENGGTMNPSLPSGFNRRQIDEVSREQARCLYAYHAPPLDSHSRSLASVITKPSVKKKAY